MSNQYPHRIRLRGPWTTRVLPGGTSVRMVMPSRWGNFRGTMLLERMFGYPGRIDADERVWLILQGYSGLARITLNGFTLANEMGGDLAQEYEVTAHLKARNLLQVELTGIENEGLWGEVALEIRCLGFLRNVQAVLAIPSGVPLLEINGVCVGPSGEVVELYAILNRRSVAYQTIIPSPEGTQFTLVSQEIPAECWIQEEVGQPLVVQIDLVKGSVVWYTFSQELPLPPALVFEEKR